MTAERKLYRYELTCAGCGKTVWETSPTDSSAKIRTAAYRDGWRFPPALTEDGKATKETVEVCPECIGEWTGRLEARFAERARRGT